MTIRKRHNTVATDNMKRQLFLHLTLIVTLFIRCSSTGEVKYLHNDRFSFTDTELSKSVPIDQSESRAIFLHLDKKEQCILIRIAGFVPKESIAGGESPAPVYWILDRKLSESGNKQTFTEIFRNYNSDWQNTPSTQVCSRDDLPLERLLPGIYRLRFSIFRNMPFRIELEVSSNTTITVLKSSEGY